MPDFSICCTFENFNFAFVLSNKIFVACTGVIWAPFPFKKIINPVPKFDKAKKLKAQGHSVSDIAEQFGLSKGRIYEYLK